MRKPILCLDFDGVVHSYTSGWKGASVIPDAPVPGALAALMLYLDAGFDVAIFSSRSKSVFGRRAMKRWLTHQLKEMFWGDGLPTTEWTIADVEADYWGEAAAIVAKITWPWFKPSALITIDDRALCFNGDWRSPEYTVDALLSFKPWNKRPRAVA